MSNYISIKGVASYHPDEEQRLDLSKNNIFVFGLNGTGKSTISRYIYNETHEYSECGFELDGECVPLVYNHQFIDDNFFNREEQKGVFTLSKNNGDIERQIASKEKLRKRLGEKYKCLKGEKTDFELEITRINEKGISEVYEKKKGVEGTSLEQFLKGFIRPKSSFYNKVKSYQPLEETMLSDLVSEMDSLIEFDGVSLKEVVLPVFGDLTDEERLILKEPIVGSDNSQLSSFIEEIDGLSWVKEGRDLYLREGQEKCPFCQSNTISIDFHDELRKLFDKSYEQRLERIIQIEYKYKNSIKTYIDGLNSAFLDCALFNDGVHKVSPLIELVESYLNDNLKEISLKSKDLNRIVEAGFCNDKVSDLASVAIEINKEVRAVNSKTAKIKESKEDLKERMWGVLRGQVDDIIRLEIEGKRKLGVKIDEKVAHLDRVEKVGRKVRDRILLLRKKSSNIDETIERINANLLSLGLVGFQIEKYKKGEEDNFFKISREIGEDNVFRSLSEGEKTLIAFLYFIELCNGSDRKDGDVNDSEKFIVIDDPISSLSQNYVYDVASLIHNELIRGARFKRVLVLTHSLFFYHELIKLSPNNKERFNNNYSLFRISKNKFSKISPIESGDIKNDYQSLWQILKDVRDSNTDPVVLPNVMRNILEHYFGFVHKKEKLGIILNELADEEPNQGFKSFYRYVNRESHSDPTNMGFMMDVQPEIYLERFKMVFDKMDDLNHYQRMLE
ncbi:AAA family ATPase [Neptuniibacter marinus]|uniref:AAA family ATPase n=1 Tax=Neptuniibacter marinus TaxID=1806670 RepID=UPI0008375FF5|nr:AAA family ATPase [Neptuniibacter marinus]